MRRGGECGKVRTHRAPFILDFRRPSVVPQLKHLVPSEQPKVTEVNGQREAHGMVPQHGPRINKCLEFLPCELCWVVVNKLLVRRQSSPDVCRGRGLVFGDGHPL